MNNKRQETTELPVIATVTYEGIVTKETPKKEKGLHPGSVLPRELCDLFQNDHFRVSGFSTLAIWDDIQRDAKEYSLWDALQSQLGMSLPSHQHLNYYNFDAHRDFGAYRNVAHITLKVNNYFSDPNEKYKSGVIISIRSHGDFKNMDAVDDIFAKVIYAYRQK